MALFFNEMHVQFSLKGVWQLCLVFKQRKSLHVFLFIRKQVAKGLTLKMI